MSLQKLDPNALADMIEAFLAINHHPSDQQFHALAEALGVDREQLEAVSYAMLHDELEDDGTGVQARSTHFDNESMLVDPDCEYSDVVEGVEEAPEITEHPGEVIINAQSTHFSEKDPLAACQDGMAELFENETPMDRMLMTGALKRISAARKLFAGTPVENVLDGENRNTDTMTTQELMLNDGPLDADNPNPGFQEETADSGSDALDRGVGLEQDQLLQTQDGLIDPEVVNR